MWRVTCYPIRHVYDGSTARRSCRGAVLIRIKAVRHVDWEIPDKFRGKEGGWSVA